MKKILSMILAVMLIAAPISAFAGSDGITVIVDGATVAFDVSPQLINDRTMVPMRAIFEAMGANVDWDGATQTVSSVRGETSIKMTVNNKSIYVNGNEVVLDVAPMLVNDRTLVPARAVAESFGADVKWIGGSQTVVILDSTKTSVREAQIKVKDYDGVISLMLFPNVAPQTVENFINLANSDFYNGLIFHRVINNFMIQGGGFDLSFTSKDTPTIHGEFVSNGVANNLKHTRGVISMARAEALDSASSQFFIVHKDTSSLDNQYASFGIVTDGMNIVDAIASVPTGKLDSLGLKNIPVSPIQIESVTAK